MFCDGEIERNWIQHAFVKFRCHLITYMHIKLESQPMANSLLYNIYYFSIIFFFFYKTASTLYFMLITESVRHISNEVLKNLQSKRTKNAGKQQKFWQNCWRFQKAFS